MKILKKISRIFIGIIVFFIGIVSTIIYAFIYEIHRAWINLAFIDMVWYDSKKMCKALKEYILDNKK